MPGGRRDAAGGVEAPESTYLYLGALRARARAGARRCSGAAWGPPGRAGRPLRRAGCALRRLGAGRDPLRSAPASSSPSWGHGGSRGGGSNRHGSAAAAAAAKEEVSARGSRFLLPGWASAGEARGGQKPGSPNSVPRDLRGGRAAPSLPSAPCDSAQAARPGQASHMRVTAAAVRVRRGLPPLPASPLPDGPSSGFRPGGGRRGRRGPGASPASPGAGSWPAVRPGSEDWGPARDEGPRGGMCGRTPCPRQPIYSRWRCPPLSSSGALSRWHCPPSLRSPA